MRVLLAAVEEVDALKQGGLVAQQGRNEVAQPRGLPRVPDACRFAKNKHKLVAIALLNLLAVNEMGQLGVDTVHDFQAEKAGQHRKAVHFKPQQARLPGRT